MARIYLASNNLHKAQELETLLRQAGGSWEVRLARELKPDIDWDETGDTFIVNALIKAATVRQWTDAAVLADDSGLIVDALGGAPGVHSSRYAGVGVSAHENNAKLLREMSQIPAGRRSARFACTLVYLGAGQPVSAAQTFTGTCPGQIALTPSGTAGFGYDPLFLVDEAGGRSMADLSAAEKNRISHRGKAMAAFLRFAATEG